jgi:ankyrin repeat protein
VPLAGRGGAVAARVPLLVAALAAVSIHRLAQAAVERLLSLGCSANVTARLDGDDAPFTTPLHLAAAANSPALVDALVRVGASLEAPDGRGRTALMAAVRSQAEFAVVRLLAAGASVAPPTAAALAAAGVGGAGLDPPSVSDVAWAGAGDRRLAGLQRQRV